MALLVDWESLEMCMMYWVFLDLTMLNRLRCVLLCRGKNASESTNKDQAHKDEIAIRVP